MEQYIVSARKYRPDSFSALIGQDTIARTLKNSILRGQLAHAYLFCGPRGVGKTSAARIFAKMINCSNPSADMEPCGECESCVSFREGRSYCIHELDAASNNGVDDIKALMEKVQIPPQVGKYSVYIIDEVHMLSQAAFNAFLKTLEEPPAHAIFILATTEKHKIIPTILSRCQTYDFNRIGVGDIVRNLRSISEKENITVDDESLHVIARKADGAMRDALTIFDQTVAFCGTDIHIADVMRNLNVLDYEYSFRLVDACLAKDYATGLLIFDEILSKGFNAKYFISALGSHLRDLLVCRTGGLESLVDMPSTLRSRYVEQASRCSVKFIFEALGIISQCEQGYREATDQRLHIEFALMRMAFISGIPADAPVAAAPAKAAPAVAEAPAKAPEAPAPAIVKPEADASAGPEVPVAEAPVAAAPAEEAPMAHAEPEPAAETLGQPAPEPIAQPAPEPALQPAPQPEAQPAAAPAPQAPKPAPRKRAAGLSMSALFEEVQVELAPEENDAVQVEVPDPETLASLWSQMAGTFGSQPRLVNALKASAPAATVEDGTVTISFRLATEAQKDWIVEKKLNEMEETFRRLSKLPKLRLVPEVQPEAPEEKKLYMPAEKARDLIARNTEVKELVKDLELDIK